MSWKFKLIILLAVVLGTSIFLNLPASQAQTENGTDARENPNNFSEENITKYPNGVMSIKPTGFGITGAVRNMPTYDTDSLVKRANFVSAEERREMRIKIERQKKGLDTDEDEDKEINELNAEIIKRVIPGEGAGYDVFQDPLVEKSLKLNAPQAMPTPSLTFDGGTAADNASLGIGRLAPPDTNGDVGPNNYVSSVNLVLKMFNKSGVKVAGPIKTSSLFAALPADDPCRVQNDGDPIVLYDSLADRWHISQFALPSSGVNSQCVALSVTGDPTGAYYVWSYPYPGGAFNDYPKVGVWTDAYHMTFNQFNPAGTTYTGAGFLSQDRAKALAGDPSASVVYFNLNTIDKTASGLLPGDIDGYVAPPTGLAEVIGEYRADEFGDPNDALRLYKWVPNFSDPSSSTLTVLPDVVLAPFDARSPSGSASVEQMGGELLDAISDRSMHRLAYRNFGTTTSPINSYVGNFTVNVSGVQPTSETTYQTGIRWFEVRRVNDTFSVFDQGTHNLTPGDGANGLNDWMGSIAQDNRGDIALGFSQAGTTQRANIMIAGRTNNTPNSGTLNEGEALMYAAGGSQTSSSGRWGDYSAMSIDPTDDCTFWYTQEYYATTSALGWSTRVGKFRYPQCVDAPKATIQGTITYCSNGSPISKASVDATGGFNRLTGSAGTYSMTVSPGTYTITAGKSSGFNSASAAPVTVAAGQTATVNVCLTAFPVVANGGVAIVSESCSIPNGAPDPGETLTVSLDLQNTGGDSTTNLTATLQGTGGVTSPSASQSYGVIAPGNTARRNFSFTVDPSIACGSNITLTFNVTDGAANYGTVTKTYSTGMLTTSLSENFDGVTAPALPSGWYNLQISGTTINWATSTTTPSSAPNAAIANDPATVNSSALLSPAVSIRTTEAQISFKNFYDTEANYDGMVLEYTTDGGTTWTDVITGGGSFVSGGYNATISPSYKNPIAGRKAWSGNSGGYINTVVNLPASLNGQTVKFRWVLGSDSAVAGTGVRIDDIVVLGGKQCSSACVQSYEADVSPRPNGDTYIDASDVQQVRRFVVGLDMPYQSNEFQRADVAPRSSEGDGFVDSDDVQQTRRYSVGTDARQTAGGATAADPILLNSNIQATILGKSFIRTKDGVLAAPAAFRVDNQNTSPGSTLVVPIRVDTVGNEAGYTFSIAFDSTILTNPQVAIGNGGGDVVFNTNNPGQIGFSVTSFSGGTIAEGNNIALVNVTFTVAAGAAAGTTPITFTDTPARRKASGVDPNTPITQPTYTGGTITISGATAAGATISGRILTSGGRGVAGAQVIVTDRAGAVVATGRTNGFGYYTVAEIAAGESYIVRVASKQYQFAARVITIVQDIDGIDFTAQP